jgi:hypothetical protein
MQNTYLQLPTDNNGFDQIVPRANLKIPKQRPRRGNSQKLNKKIVLEESRLSAAK